LRIEPGAVFEGYSRRVERDDAPSADAKQLPSSMETLRSAAETVEIAEASH
jgi:hypothetical protein